MSHVPFSERVGVSNHSIPRPAIVSPRYFRGNQHYLSFGARMATGLLKEPN